MENSIFNQTAKFLRERRNNRRWRAVVFCLAVIVVCGTAWVLSKKGQALTRAEEILDCQLIVHEHDEGCYDEDGNQICGKADFVFHEHDDACYDADGELVCRLPEIKEHVHTGDCFETEEILICQYEKNTTYDDQIPDEEDGNSADDSGSTGELVLTCSQEEHTHDESCYEYETEKTTYEETVEIFVCSREEHEHDEGCRNEEGEMTCEREEHTHDGECYEYETVSYEEEGETQEILICSQEEHEHSDDCYSEVSEKPDTDKDTGFVHEHDEGCYRIVRKLICDEKAAHTHDDDCYDPEGSLVCEAAFIEFVETHVHSEECFRAGDDVAEYTKTFSNDDIAVTAVYGKSANIPKEAKLRVEQTMEETDPSYFGQRLEELEEAEGVLEEDETLAMLLQIMFYTDEEILVPEDKVNITVQFLNDNIYNEDDAVKAVCFTKEGVETLSDTGTGSDSSVTFELSELTELAFIAQAEGEVSKSHILTYEGEDYIVTATLGEDIDIPEGAELSVEQITEETDPEYYEQCQEELKEAEFLSDEEETIGKLLRMKIFADGEEVLQNAAMDITVQFRNREIYFEGDQVKVAHFTKEGARLLPDTGIDDQLSTTFTVNELGEFAFIINADIRTMTYEGEDFIVTVRFGKEAMIPKEAELLAERITPESDPEHFAQRENQVQEEISDELIAVKALMNIGFYVEGEEIEPRDSVEVKIQLLEEDSKEKDAPFKEDSLRVVHFAEDGLEIFEDIDITENDEKNLSASFQLDSFSEVAVVENGTVKDATTFRQAMGIAKDGQTIEVCEDFEFTDDGSGAAKLKMDAGETGKKTVTLDLKGHEIKLIGNVTLVDIEPHTELILTDSTMSDPVRTGEAGYNYSKPDRNLPGTLNYSVTESVSIGNGMTQETPGAYQVSGGAIVGNSENGAAVFYVASGTLTIKNGIVFGNDGRAVQVEVPSWWDPNWGSAPRPTLNLSGGYLVGNGHDSEKKEPDGSRKENPGGAIHCVDGTINIDGNSVIAGNRGFRGGGILVKDNSSININGGYISNNTATWMPRNGDTDEIDWSWAWYGGGGGILLCNNSELTMTGGYITGNVSHLGGAGIGVDFYWGIGDEISGRVASKSALKITGGYISGNVGDGLRGEGGGIGIYDSSTITIEGSSEKLYITNNRLTRAEDWGGGGLFIGENGKAYLFNTLIANNYAEGFGGGLAGCSTGRIIEGGENSQKGVAVFDNTAGGNAFAGGTSVKNQDRVYAGNKDDGVNPAFWQRDDSGRYLFQDYFSALYSQVEAGILGGGLAGWDGSVDGERIDTNAGSWVSSFIIGLTAHPDANAKEAARGAAKTYITGNSSSVHGGGVMCNGIMIFGDTTTAIEINSALELKAKKVLTDEKNQKLDIEAGQFSFTVYEDENCTKPVTTGTNGAMGVDGTAEITFNQPLTFDLRRDLQISDVLTLKKNDYTYFIKEEISKDPRNSGIKFDESIFMLKVKVEQEWKEELNGVQKYVDDIKEVTLHRKADNGWVQIDPSYNPPSDEKHAVTVLLIDNSRDDGAVFRNLRSNVTSIKAEKKWDGVDPEKINVDSVQVALYRTVKGSGSEKAKVEGSEKILNAENGWKSEWKELQADPDCIYEAVEENVVYKDGSSYESEGRFDVKYEHVTKDNTTTFIITNSPKTYRIELTKVGEDQKDKVLTGAKFELINADGLRLEFTQHTGSYVYYNGTDSKGVSPTMVTNEEGRIDITGLPAGTYTLRETQAPAGYKNMWDHTFTLGDEDFDLTCEEKKKGQKICTEAEITADSQGNGVFKLKLTDKEDKYELPETGGFGTCNITILGAVLMCGIAALMYRIYRRRREG